MRKALHGKPFTHNYSGWTSQALGHLAALDWLHGTVPWWNPFEGLGAPLIWEPGGALTSLVARTRVDPSSQAVGGVCRCPTPMMLPGGCLRKRRE
jgi:hypothetical protein